MFHQNLILWKSKSPVISWITGLCFLGCPDGLEPWTFRTTSYPMESRETPLYTGNAEY